MDKNNLPVRYYPFKELVVCTNTLIDGKIPIEIEGHIPFLVGNSDIPQVWLSVPGAGGQWIDILAGNRRIEEKKTTLKQYLLTVEESVKEKRVDVQLWKTMILSVVKESETRAVVTHLDLRPLNLLIHGDTTGLNIGNQVIRNNTVSNVHTMIGID